MSSAAIVVIGRNEGAGLERCLRSALSCGVPVVYADSGSTDGSPARARALGVEVVELSPSRPFSAARGRNEGVARLLAVHPEVEAVQFVDGDCELVPGWFERGLLELSRRADAAVVCGRVREREPEASLYNRLCALEWQLPPGEVKACGGIFVVRTAVFRALGGFRDDVLAGEEPEFCLRVRRSGHKVLHVPEDMVWHDAALLRFGQWWWRARRGGRAYAQGAALHGGPPDHHFVRECRSALAWALGPLALALGLAWPTSGLSLALLLAYPLQALRIARKARVRSWSARDRRLYGVFTVIAKFAEAQGVLEYRWRRPRRPPAPAPGAAAP